MSLGTMDETLAEFFDRDDYFSTSTISGEVTAVRDYLLNHFSVETTVENFIRSLRARNAPLRDGGFDLRELFRDVFLPLVKEFIETHNALLKLLAALKQHPETSHMEHMKYELEQELFYFEDPDVKFSLRTEIRKELENINRFAALAYHEGIHDLGEFGVYIVRSTLAACGPHNIGALDRYAPVVAQWIIVSGQKLYDNSEEAKENWARWKTVLEWMAEHPQLYESTKSLCKQAAEEMERIAS